jgi:hypothetical protein
MTEVVDPCGLLLGDTGVNVPAHGAVFKEPNGWSTNMAKMTNSALVGLYKQEP